MATNTLPPSWFASRSALLAAGNRSFAKQRQLQVFQPGQITFELFDFLAERVHILELAVDRGETYVGDLIEVLQLAHDQLTELARRYFALAAAAQVVDDRAHRTVYIMGGYRP